jgi:hypothetical protein
LSEEIDPDRVPVPGDLIQSTLADQAKFIVIRDPVESIACCIRGTSLADGGDVVSAVSIDACEVLKIGHIEERVARRVWKNLPESSKDKFRAFVRENGKSMQTRKG